MLPGESHRESRPTPTLPELLGVCLHVALLLRCCLSLIATQAGIDQICEGERSEKLAVDARAMICAHFGFGTAHQSSHASTRCTFHGKLDLVAKWLTPLA